MISEKTTRKTDTKTVAAEAQGVNLQQSRGSAHDRATLRAERS